MLTLTAAHSRCTVVARMIPTLRIPLGLLSYRNGFLHARGISILERQKQNLPRPRQPKEEIAQKQRERADRDFEAGVKPKQGTHTKKKPKRAKHMHPPLSTANTALTMGDINFLWPVQPERPHALSIVMLGTPNAGKSVLVNKLIQDKVSAVSPKRHTTQQAVLGVVTKAHVQLTIYDTPGVSGIKHMKHYQERLANIAWNKSAVCDYGLVVIDSVKKLGDAEHHLLTKARALMQDTPQMKLILVLNKVDLVHPKSKLLDLTKELMALVPEFEDVFMISATEEDGLDDLDRHLFDLAKPREWEYDEEMTTDQSDLDRVEEIIREKVYNRLNQEIPYTVTQENIGWTYLSDGALRIDQRLVVDTDNQKRILIGKSGEVLKEIGSKACADLEKALKQKVHLFLRVSSEKSRR